MRLAVANLVFARFETHISNAHIFVGAIGVKSLFFNLPIYDRSGNTNARDS